MSQDSPTVKINERERLLRDTFTIAERLTLSSLLVASLVLFTIAEPRSYWTMGFVLILGILAPAILKVHERNHPFIIVALWRRFWIYSAPITFFCLQFVVGLMNNPVVSIEFDGQLYDSIIATSVWLPTSVITAKTWLAVLTYASIYLLCMNLYIVPKSRSFFERALPLFCLLAVILAVLGYLQVAMGANDVIFTNGTGQSDFFAFFPYDGHWAAFATIWTAACIGMALLNSRYDPNGSFIDSSGPWYLTGATLLAASGFIIQAKWPSTVLLITFSILLMFVAIHFLTKSNDRNRNLIALFCGLGSSIIFAATIVRLFQFDTDTSNSNVLHQAALEIFKDRPLLGWGFDSFAQIAPFYTADTILGAKYDRASTDVVHYLAELGLVGALLLPITCLIVLLEYLRERRNVVLSQHLLIGCAGVVVLAFCDSPFMSPAVFLSFFIVFFSAMRWAKISRVDSDSLDTKPQLVISDKERGVPIFTGEYKDITK